MNEPVLSETASTLPVIDHWLEDSRWAGTGDRLGDVFDPARGEVASHVRLASTQDVDAVVAAARTAHASWRHTSLSKRSAVMFGFRDALKRRADDLAAVISSQHGKVRSDAAGELQRGLEVVEFACGIPSLLTGGFTEGASTDVDVTTIRQSVGVTVGITPFNFPGMVPLWMCPVAVACGNSFILKPSERDPGASMILAECWAEAGLPAGVFSVLHGDAEVVNALLGHPGVDAVSFVGSTPIARHVYEAASVTGMRVQALGGAKNHMIVLPDADLEAVADAAVSAGYGSAGERCMAVSVVVAVDPVGDDLVAAIAERTRDITVGPGCDDASEMGPLVTAAHRDRVRGYVDAAEGDGATLVVDGRGLKVEGAPDGFWMGPTLIDGVATDMSVYTDEVFGPVLCVVRVDSYEEAVDLVNTNPYGNGVAIFTRDGGAARRFAGEVEAGMVGVNVAIPVPVAYHSFGGWGESLFGDTHVYGPEGVAFYTRNKVITTRWADPATRGPDLGFPTHT
ncbi:MAG: CoA-acylating methylmalonate-semialdehyde dehydrogenase [Microthrixaceae bacterium]